MELKKRKLSYPCGGFPGQSTIQVNMVTFPYADQYDVMSYKFVPKGAKILRQVEYDLLWPAYSLSLTFVHTGYTNEEYIYFEVNDFVFNILIDGIL